ncbi:MAG: hypothetical protein H7196_00580 [candidate division SR1 bacterium]|nr:hypothetical protein [candidate division SR1 bacterium]
MPKFNLKKCVLIAKDGINIVVEGEDTDLESHKKLQKGEFYQNIYFKKSKGTGKSFSNLQVCFHDEIGTLVGVIGEYITSKELHSLFDNTQKFYIIDIHNDYKSSAGYFQSSILFKKFHNFHGLPKVLLEIEHLKNKKIITVCASGVRYEEQVVFFDTT